VKESSASKKAASVNVIDQEKIELEKILKDFESKIKNIGKHHTKAKKSAEDLLRKLQANANEYLKNKRTPQISCIFIDKCKISIHQSFKVLQRDLGWGDYLLNMLKAIVRAVRYVLPLGNENTFFQKKAVGVEAAEKLEMDLLRLSKNTSAESCTPFHL